MEKLLNHKTYRPHGRTGTYINDLPPFTIVLLHTYIYIYIYCQYTQYLFDTCTKIKFSLNTINKTLTATRREISSKIVFCFEHRRPIFKSRKITVYYILDAMFLKYFNRKLARFGFYRFLYLTIFSDLGFQKSRLKVTITVPIGSGIGRF